MRNYSKAQRLTITIETMRRMRQISVSPTTNDSLISFTNDTSLGVAWPLEIDRQTNGRRMQTTNAIFVGHHGPRNS